MNSLSASYFWEAVPYAPKIVFCRDIMRTPILDRSSLMIHLICVFNVLHSAFIFMMKCNSCSVNYNNWI